MHNATEHELRRRRRYQSAIKHACKRKFTRQTDHATENRVAIAELLALQKSDSALKLKVTKVTD